MSAALDIWPVLFVGLWAYPFIAIPFMRRRRLVMDLAAIGSGRRHDTYGEACEALRAFQARMRDDWETDRIEGAMIRRANATGVAVPLRREGEP